jgi:hypothetical protein
MAYKSEHQDARLSLDRKPADGGKQIGAERRLTAG